MCPGILTRSVFDPIFDPIVHRFLVGLVLAAAAEGPVVNLPVIIEQNRRRDDGYESRQAFVWLWMTTDRQNLRIAKRVLSKRAATWLYAPHSIIHYYCKFGISRIPQVSNARIHLDIKPEEDLYPFLASDGLILVLVFLCVFMGLSIHPMGNSSPVGLATTLTSKSWPRKLVNSFASFQRPRWVELPSHLLWLNIPLPIESSLFGIDTETQYVSLTSIAAIWMMGKGKHNIYMRWNKVGELFP